MKLFASLIKAKRFPMGMREASKIIGVSQATLCRAESGGTLDIESFYKISKFVGLELGFLLECYMENMSELYSYSNEVKS